MTFQQIYRDYPQHHEELDELAGKLEYDNEFNRDEAEYETAYVMMKRHLLFVQGHLFNPAIDT